MAACVIIASLLGQSVRMSSRSFLLQQEEAGGSYDPSSNKKIHINGIAPASAYCDKAAVYHEGEVVVQKPKSLALLLGGFSSSFAGSQWRCVIFRP